MEEADPTESLLTSGRRVAIDPALLGDWIEPEVPTAEQTSRATLVAGVLWNASQVMLDDLFTDVSELDAAFDRPEAWPELVADSRVLSAPPRRFHHRLTPGHANRFVVVAVDLISRLSYGWRPCSCTAQELMLWVLLGTGVGIVETYGIDLVNWHAEVCDALFEDLDFENLFDEALDGFEEDDRFVDQRMENMRFDDWFVPFGNRRLPPYAEDERLS